jgi:hemerythrin
MKYEFTPDLLTGNTQIDNQHRTLIDALNKLFEACSAGKGRQELAAAAKFLSNYTATHFADEEVLQQKSQYPDHVNHKRAHEQFKLTVKTLMAKLNEQGPTIALVGEMNSALGGWLLNHIKREDVRVAAHIRKQAGGA